MGVKFSYSIFNKPVPHSGENKNGETFTIKAAPPTQNVSRKIISLFLEEKVEAGNGGREVEGRSEINSLSTCVSGKTHVSFALLPQLVVRLEAFRIGYTWDHTYT